MIRFCKLRDVKTPTRGSKLSAGIDFYVPNDFMSRVVSPGEDILIPSGIKMEIPEHCALIGIDKSGVSSSTAAKDMAGLSENKQQIPSSTIIGAKLIDADYPGEIHIHLINTGKKNIIIEPGYKIGQFILVPVFYDNLIEVAEESLIFPISERLGGFGSTGV